MGLFGKKKDFWDEVDDSSMKESGSQTFIRRGRGGYPERAG